MRFSQYTHHELEEKQGLSFKKVTSQIYEDHYNLPDCMLVKLNSILISSYQSQNLDEEKVPEERQLIDIDDERPAYNKQIIDRQSSNA